MNEIFCILIPISPKFVPKGPIDNKLALVQIMAWRRNGDKPLHEQMLIQFTDVYMWHLREMSYVALQISSVPLIMLITALL